MLVSVSWLPRILTGGKAAPSNGSNVFCSARLNLYSHRVVDADPSQIFDHDFELSKNILIGVDDRLTIHSEENLPFAGLHCQTLLSAASSRLFCPSTFPSTLK